MIKEYETILIQRYVKYKKMATMSCDTCEAGHLQEISYILHTLFGYDENDMIKLDLLATEPNY